MLISVAQRSHRRQLAANLGDIDRVAWAVSHLAFTPNLQHQFSFQSANND
jgi:hypothetical protein